MDSDRHPRALQCFDVIRLQSAFRISGVTSVANRGGHKFVYDSFGNVTASTGSLTNRFEYTGREFDAEIGIYYYRARYHDPLVGRFISEDPIRNRTSAYTYVRNRPLDFRDPRGLPPMVVLSEAAAAIGWSALLW